MLRIAGIEKDSIVDGIGLRYVIFLQGCNHRCKDCHNPESHDFEGGKLVDETTLLVEIKEQLEILDGITLSGGDPLFQAKELINFVKQCKKLNINIWLYTGFIFDEFIKFKNKLQCDERINQDMIDLLELIDVVVDGPFISEYKTLEKPFIGSSNQRIIQCNESLLQNKIIESGV